MQNLLGKLYRVMIHPNYHFPSQILIAIRFTMQLTGANSPVKSQSIRSIFRSPAPACVNGWFIHKIERSNKRCRSFVSIKKKIFDRCMPTFPLKFEFDSLNWDWNFELWISCIFPVHRWFGGGKKKIHACVLKNVNKQDETSSGEKCTKHSMIHRSRKKSRK